VLQRRVTRLYIDQRTLEDKATISFPLPDCLPRDAASPCVFSLRKKRHAGDSNPLRASLREQASAEPGIAYRGYTMRIGEDSQDYCVVFPDGRVRFGSISDIKGDIDAWFTGALQGH